MPDCKFWTTETAGLYTKAGDYPEVMRKALKEMHRQVGELVIDETGLARRGVLVRHLVMPGHLEETRGVLAFLANEISTETYVNIMDQYRPCHRAFEYDNINRPLRTEEYQEALSLAKKYGLHRLDQREWKKLLRHLGL